MKVIQECLVCGEDVSQYKTPVKDYLVSGDKFDLVVCSKCGLLHTSPAPLKKDIYKYYQSQDYISHLQSPTTILQKIYFVVRNIMLNKKFRIVKKHCTSEDKILDFGCGTGEFLSKCISKGMQGYGLEPDSKARNVARKVVEGQVFEDIGELHQLSNEFFDIITLWHVIEHIHDLNESMEVFFNYLKYGGVLILAVPEHESYDAKFYKNKWAAYDVPRHLYHFNKESITYLANKHGFSLVQIKPLIFDSFYISLISEKRNKFIIVKYLRAVLVGLRSNIQGLMGLNPFSSQIYVLKKEHK